MHDLLLFSSLSGQLKSLLKKKIFVLFQNKDSCHILTENSHQSALLQNSPFRTWILFFPEFRYHNTGGFFM